MSNLYYNYRGDNPGQRPPAPIPASHQHLVPAKESNPSLSTYSVPPVQQALPLRQPSAPSAQPASLAFPSSQAWAADQSAPQHHQQQPPQHHAQQPSHHHPLVNTAYPASQPLRTAGNHVMNGTHATHLGSRRVPPYEESLFQMMGKPFPDKSSRSAAPSSTSVLLPLTPALDQYQQIRSAASSNVFDPSEFPSLGGGLRSQGGIPMSAAGLLPSASAPDASALPGPVLPVPPMNGIGPYDMYNMPSYGDGRAKAVDAVTGSSASAEFNMQSEDFPALGGNSVPGSMRANMINSGPNGPSLSSSAGGRLGPISSVEKSGLPEGYFDSSAVGGPHTQLHPTSGRALTRPDHVISASLIERQGQASGESQGGEDLDSAPVQSSPQKSQSQLQSRVPLKSEGSPSKSGYPTRPAVHGTSIREPVTSETGRNRDAHDSSSDSSAMPSHIPDDAVTGMPNGDALGMGGFSSPTGGQPQSNSSLLSRMAGTQSRGETKASGSVLPADQFGMKGLLQYVGAEAEGTDANMLSIGVDLTMLGLDLNSAEPLHRTFANPWEGGQGGVPGVSDASGAAQKNEEPEYRLPTCYYMQPPALKNSHFTKFQLETLFYVFYNMPRDVLQVLAAIELYNRKWMYHKDLKLWFTCEPEAMQGYERGSYIYFDIKSWEQRPFHDANQAFIQGLMTEDEVRSVPMPGQRSSTS